MANQNNSSKKGFFLTRWIKRFFFGAGKEVAEMSGSEAARAADVE